MTATSDRNLRVAIVGAGPVGLAVALLVARWLPHAQIHLLDARPAEAGVDDPRTIAVSLGSVQLLQQLSAWPSSKVQPIAEVEVSQQPSRGEAWLLRSVVEPVVRIRAADEAVPMLGAVVGYGELVAPLQQAWSAAAAAEPRRLTSAFGRRVSRLVGAADGASIHSPDPERFDLVVVAEGGRFGEQERKAIVRDYRQRAWIGTLALPPTAPECVAYECFTRQGPAALLPLPGRRAALVWCVAADDDPVAELDRAQRLAVLNTIFPLRVRPLRDISELKCFPLGLNAERTLTDGRIVRIGNAAQTLHPVAGQGLNLGLRDAWALVDALRRHREVDRALRRLEWQRAPDRWSTIVTTDFLARSFTWQWPGVGAARALGLAALQGIGPLKSALARRMMFGSR